MTHTFYEFFAGGGMARAGLGGGWSCLFANDIDAAKVRAYESNFRGPPQPTIKDIRDVTLDEVPGKADLAWASFPCQDLSLAGSGAGLKGGRSSTFWPFWRLVRGLGDERRYPSLIVIENVYGLLTSHGGRDFAAIGEALADADYSFGGLLIDAVLFVPQSRPRLFIVACKVAPPSNLVQGKPNALWHPPAMINAVRLLSDNAASRHVWLSIPAPRSRESSFAEIIEEQPTGVTWHTASETEYLLSLMSDINRAKVEAARKLGKRVVGGVYRRTRTDASGEKSQRAEVRFDEVAGCLRTPAGGSSRQTILVVEGRRIRSRLLSPRETARLMGLPDSYQLPSKYNEAYHLTGDGVVVPVVRHLAAHLLEPSLAASVTAGDHAA